ncbi:MAG TPA: SDR family NAD(P)-dependent oxidoreductase [Chitinophagaceae bacterium]|nr:SDR family NAD(P)-dependent oxidoreductase [Chitinophagaceae bacterium]
MKTVIVTGSLGNLGLPIVRKFIEESYKVVGTVTPTDDVPVDLPENMFEKVIVDLMSEEESENFVAGVISRHHAVDAAILTVGGFAMGSVTETKTSDVRKQYKLNFETAFNIARPVFKEMLKQNSGRIFLVGSRPGLDAMNGKGMVAYSLGKSLIFRLAELMNDEAKGSNVVTSVVVPSTIDTPQNRKAMPDIDPANWVKAEAIADIIHFYCTDAAVELREPVIKVYHKS